MPRGLRPATPAVTRLFGVEGSVGLTDVLVGDVDLDQALVPWQDGTLSILPAGSLPPDPVALLGSQAMAGLVAELRSRFDVVIYDSDPMIAATDAIVLARALDGLVLVVRSGTTTRDHLAACLEKVREARVPLLGTVLFAVRMSRRARRSYLAVDREGPRAELAGCGAAGGRSAGRRSQPAEQPPEPEQLLEPKRLPEPEREPESRAPDAGSPVRPQAHLSPQVRARVRPQGRPQSGSHVESR